MSSSVPESIRELLEVCSNEQMLADDPRMEPLRQWLVEEPSRNQLLSDIWSFDESIRNTYLNADIPAGLAERIRAKIKDEALSTELAKSNSGVELRSKDAEFYSRNRRVWIGSASFALTLSLVMLGIGYLLGWFAPTPPQIVHYAPNWHDQIQWVADLPTVAKWNSDLTEKPEDYPYSDDLRVPPVAWSPFETKYDEHSIVFDCTPSGKEDTYLFVFKSDSTWDFRHVFPAQPHYAADGYSLAASHDKERVFVLVVMGNKSVYQSRVKPTPNIVMNSRDHRPSILSNPHWATMVSHIDLWLQKNKR